MKPVRVDQLLNSDLRPYRIPFLRRISESGSLALTVWHGNPAVGMGAPVVPPEDVPVPDRSVGNLFWPGRGHRIVWQRGALRILRSDAAVVVCAEVIHNLTVWLMALMHGLFGKRLVLTGFFYRPGKRHLLSPLSDLLRRMLHRRADVFLAYTERGRDQLIANGFPSDRVFVSQNTLDTERLIAAAQTVGPKDVYRLREELALEEQQVLLYLGRLTPVKRVEVAIELLKTLDRSAALVVVGEGFCRDELERMGRGLPIRFCGAIYDESELAGYFKLADLLVLPGRVGLTCVHGFANGVPCVTTSEAVVEQSPEYAYVEHDYNGLVLPQDDPVAYADEVGSLLKDEPRMNRLRKGAIETAERLKMGRMVEQYEQAVLRAAGL